MSKIIANQIERIGGVAFTLPATDGTVGHVLQTDGIGNLSVAALLTTGIADSAVTNAKMADDAVGLAELSATGTLGTTTFLRGDNTWEVPVAGTVNLTTNNFYKNWVDVTADQTTTVPTTLNAGVIGPVEVNTSGSDGWTIDGELTII
jgi:hypothetical protein